MEAQPESIKERRIIRAKQHRNEKTPLHASKSICRSLLTEFDAVGAEEVTSKCSFLETEEQDIKGETYATFIQSFINPRK